MQRTNALQRPFPVAATTALRRGPFRTTLPWIGYATASSGGIDRFPTLNWVLCGHAQRTVFALHHHNQHITMERKPLWKRLQLIVPSCIIIGFCFCWLPCKWKNTSTVVFLVRHAEKASAPANNPPLTAAGLARANELARVLGQCGVQVIHQTEFTRTRQTAAPLATATGLVPVENPANDVQAVAELILGAERGKVVVVVGHSNTVPDLIQRLTGTVVAPIPESMFDELYQVIIPRCGPKRVLHMKYGAPTP